jgi:rod shape-determining protein MreD
MTILKWTGIFVLCFALQTTLVPVIGIFGVHPDLLVVALFFLAIRTGPLPAVWVGFFLGLAQDLYAPSVLGQHALSMTAAGFFAGLFNERVMRVDVMFRMVLLLITFVVNDALFLIVQFVKTGTGTGAILHGLLASTLPRALYSMLFALLPYLKDRFFAPTSRR